MGRFGLGLLLLGALGCGQTGPEDRDAGDRWTDPFELDGGPADGGEGTEVDVGDDQGGLPDAAPAVYSPSSSLSAADSTASSPPASASGGAGPVGLR